MRKLQLLASVAILLGVAIAAPAQVRPYIGYAYPAGGQQGTTVRIRVGGQGVNDVNGVLVTGCGVTAKVVECYRRLDNQEMDLLNEQLRELKRATSAVASASEKTAASSSPPLEERAGERRHPMDNERKLITRIENRVREFVQTPACAAISTLTFVEVTIRADAEPGAREIRLVTPRGVSNPLAFHVGQVPEFSRKPMLSATIQVLGKEARSLRKRPLEEVEDHVTLPCTLNGQIASGEVNRYRFEARKGQRLVISTHARALIPYIADAVPGWFQPVLALYDAKGKEVAFDDDYRFKPDPVILYEVASDGEYVLAISDSLHRGREDFVYRITLGEMPFVTSLFPPGQQCGSPTFRSPEPPTMKGWNLQEAKLTLPPADAARGIHSVVAVGAPVPPPATGGRLVSEPVSYAVDALPDPFEAEPNNSQAAAQKVTLPLIINGRIDRPDDWDVFQFRGKSNETVVAEVQARRLDSSLDSVLKLTDAAGHLLAFNDDREDLGAGVNTHHADSWLMATLPADGDYFVQIGDTARKGGEEYAYRLRISQPQPDFALRVVPSSISLRSKQTASLTVYAIRKDGFTGPIKLTLKNPPPGFSAAPVTISGTQTLARLTIKTDLSPTKEPVSLTVAGSANVGTTGSPVQRAHEAVPAEDRMQAFLWRHLLPASDLKAVVFDPTDQPRSKRVPPARQPSIASTNAVAVNKSDPTNGIARSNTTLLAAAPKPKFTKQQVAARLRQINRLYEDGLLTDDFYLQKIAECDAAQ